MKCNNCGGFGILLKESLHLQRRYGNPSIKLYCPKCKGKKEIDWIENILGVNKYPNERLGVVE